MKGENGGLRLKSFLISSVVQQVPPDLTLISSDLANRNLDPGASRLHALQEALRMVPKHVRREEPKMYQKG